MPQLQGWTSACKYGQRCEQSSYWRQHIWRGSVGAVTGECEKGQLRMRHLTMRRYSGFYGAGMRCRDWMQRAGALFVSNTFIYSYHMSNFVTFHSHLFLSSFLLQADSTSHHNFNLISLGLHSCLILSLCLFLSSPFFLANPTLTQYCACPLTPNFTFVVASRILFVFCCSIRFHLCPFLSQFCLESNSDPILFVLTHICFCRCCCFPNLVRA